MKNLGTHIVYVTGEAQRQQAIRYVTEAPFYPLYTVIVKPAKMSRSVAQNALYWIFNTHLEKHSETGNTKNEWHEYFKEKYLVRIYIKNPDKHPALCSSIEAITAIMEKGLTSEAAILWKNLLATLSTTSADVAEFKEYLECIEHEMIDFNCVLPVEDDVYRKALAPLTNKELEAQKRGG